MIRTWTIVLGYKKYSQTLNRRLVFLDFRVLKYLVISMRFYTFQCFAYVSLFCHFFFSYLWFLNEYSQIKYWEEKKKHNGSELKMRQFNTSRIGYKLQLITN